MDILRIDIDAIVRRVLADFQATGDPNAACPESTQAACAKCPTGVSKDIDSVKCPATPTEQSSSQQGSLLVTAKVVTLAEVEDRLKNATGMTVRRDAVITPSVRDELRRRNIQLSYADTPASASTKNIGAVVESRSVLIVTSHANVETTRLASMLQTADTHCTTETSDCLIESCDIIARHLHDISNKHERGHVGVLLTRYVAPATCLANRLEGVRAITTSEIDAIQRDAKSVGANLLIVDPSRMSQYTLRQLLQRFRDAAPYRCPDVFQQRLG